MTGRPDDPREEWTGWRGHVRRLVMGHLFKILFAILAVGTLSLWSSIKVILRTPQVQAEQRILIDSVFALSTATAREVSDMSEAFWAGVALQCLGLPNDSSVVMTRLPCGKAYTRSNIRTPDGRPWR